MDSQSLLGKIPLEILLHVSSYLSTRDLGSLRRTCKHVETSLFNTFSTEFFTRKQFMLSDESLQALIDISNHPRLSLCLSHVVVGLDLYENGRSAPGFRQAVRANQYRIGRVNQFTLLSLSRDRDMLAQAFRNLPNLQTVGLQDYNSGGRVRDDCVWTSYGATTVFQETGVRLIDEHRLRPVSDEQTRFASRVFCTILSALGQSGAKPQTFVVLLRKRRSGLLDDAFNLPEDLKPSVKPVLSNLKTLLLALNLSSEPMFLTTGDDTGPEVECPDYLLRHYLRHTPNLTHLRLNFQNAQPSRVEQFLLWLGRPVMQTDSVDSSSGPPLPKPQSPDPVALSQLRRLDFGMLVVPPRVLLAVIRKFKSTLRELSLWKVTLKPPQDQQQQLLDERANVWAEFFSQLSDLDYISVGCLSQQIGNQTQVVKFKPPANQSGEMSSAREYSGEDMRHFPNELLSDSVVNWPKATISDDEDESMSDATNDDEAGTDDGE